MVFTKLSTQEKDAFFGLLDEYFQSRPELFGQGGQGAGGIAGTGVSTAAAASVVQRALAVNANASGGTSAPGKSNNPYLSNVPAPSQADIARAVTVGRVAAASLAFSGAAPSQSSSSPSPLSALQGGGNAPPILPRRGAPSAPVGVGALADRIGSPGMEVDKLVTRKTSVFSAFKKPESSGGVAIPSAFTAPTNTFGPPPTRRVASEASGGGGGGSGAGGRGPIQRHVAPASEPEPEAQEEVAEGEWAEVLYDYNSEDPGDLTIRVGMRVFVTEKTSDDWWTGQSEEEEKQGLFPASYVKLL